MQKVLIINTIGLGFEGMSSVIRNYAAAMDCTGLELHFTATPDIDDKVRAAFEQYGTIHVLPFKKDDLPAYFLGIRRLVRQEKISVVHIHGNSGMMIFEVLAARLGGAKGVLAHCHSTSCDHPRLNPWTVPFVKLLSTKRIACSQGAGEWLYGRSSYVQLNNAIDLNRFRFDPAVRAQTRQELGIPEGCFVLGHVGNFYEAKNQEYLVELFCCLHATQPDTRLIMAGSGEQMEALQQEVRRRGMQESIQFLGKRTDPERLYQAMDLFVMPSRWEGLPLVSLEAQAAGLPVILSDRITREAGCTRKVHYESIEKDPADWAALAAQIRAQAAPRADDSADQLRAAGFDIAHEADRLRRMYLGEE